MRLSLSARCRIAGDCAPTTWLFPGLRSNRPGNFQPNHDAPSHRLHREAPTSLPVGFPALDCRVDQLASASPSEPERGLTLNEGFYRPEIPKRLGYTSNGFQLQPSIHCRDGHWHHVTNPDATSSVASTGLSYTAIRTACTVRYRLVQISPPRLAAVSRRACSPPAGGKFDGLPPPLPGTFTRSLQPGSPRFRCESTSPSGPCPRRPISRKSDD